MLYLYLLIPIVFIILVLVARRATRVNPIQYGTMPSMTTVRDRYAHQAGANLAQRDHLREPGEDVISAHPEADAEPVSSNVDRLDAAMAPPNSPADSFTEGQAQVAYDAEALVGFYQKMVEIRLFEDASTKAFRQGKIGGYLHVYSGQEAVATAFIHAMKEGDITITAYRDHAHALLQGADPNRVMAELYGKGTGIVKGKGGSMHLFHTEGGMYGGYGIVGGHIPLGPGMAYGKRYQGGDEVVQLYLGDGAIHNGAFHEAANLAGLWGKDGMCPTLFILEN